jgi:DNA-directed RNA polymerase specialized sigma24 family protein
LHGYLDLPATVIMDTVTMLEKEGLAVSLEDFHFSILLEEDDGLVNDAITPPKLFGQYEHSRFVREPYEVGFVTLSLDEDINFCSHGISPLGGIARARGSFHHVLLGQQAFWTDFRKNIFLRGRKCPRMYAAEQYRLKAPSRAMNESVAKKSKEVAATPEEVIRAIGSLTDAELKKLNDYARIAILALGKYAGVSDAKDLLQEAIQRVLEDKRHWKPAKIDFVGFLIGAMKSIASSWKNHAKRTPPTIRESDFPEPDKESPPNPYDLARDSRSGPLQQLLDSDLPPQEWLVGEIETMFADDPVCSLILGAWRDGENGSMIMKTLELSRTQYDTAVRRIGRKVLKRWPEGRPNVR